MPPDARRAELEAALRDTEEHVAQGEQDIARLAVMERLEALGVGDQAASKALAALRRSQVLFVEVCAGPTSGQRLRTQRRP